MTEQRVWEQTVIVFGPWIATQAVSEWAVGKVLTRQRRPEHGRTTRGSRFGAASPPPACGSVGLRCCGQSECLAPRTGFADMRFHLMATLCAKTMDYRGLGSGIIRALKADSNIEFRNEATGDQFRAILWRTTQKSDLKDEGSEKIGQKTTQKTEKNGEITQKSSEKTNQGSEKIISLLRTNSKITISQLANELSISDRAVSKQLKKLQESGKIRRVGPDKGGHWEVL